MTAPYAIRTFGDPVLKLRCSEVGAVDADLRKLVDDMIVTMYEAPGVGLAAPQIGVQKRIFVYDDEAGGGARVIVNPVITETSGEWRYEEGCLSVPGLFFPIVRPARVVMEATDLEGKPLRFEVDELLGRIFQHELDHLDGLLLMERLDPDQRKQAMRALRERAMHSPS